MIQSFDCETVENCWIHVVKEMVTKTHVEGRDQLNIAYYIGILHESWFEEILMRSQLKIAAVMSL